MKKCDEKWRSGMMDVGAGIREEGWMAYSYTIYIYQGLTEYAKHSTVCIGTKLF